jgi:hypothetical protein
LPWFISANARSRARQATLAGADQQQMNLILAGADEQRRAGACRCSAGNAGDHGIHLLGVRTCSFGSGLRTTQLRRCDHLHRLGDLLRRLGRGDADAHVFK